MAVGCQLLLSLSCVVGKGYRNGYAPPGRNTSTLAYNYSPGPLLSLEDLPSAWDWCNVEGTDLCVSSWNQHECAPPLLLPLWGRCANSPSKSCC